MSLGTPSTKVLKVLLDSGSDGTLLFNEHAQNLKQETGRGTMWNTAAGSFKTQAISKILFKLPELSESKVIETKVHLTTQPSSYDMIIGNDLLKELGIDLKYSDMTITWNDVIIPMRPRDAAKPEYFAIEDSDAVREATNRIKHILDAKYEPANLEEVVASCTHLKNSEQHQLQQLLQSHDDLFDGSLGHWKKEKYHINLKHNVVPYHARAYPIPKIYEQTLQMEVDRLCQLGVLKKVNRSEWAAPTFIIPKKDGTVRFISDFRELNKRVQRTPFPVPKIQDLLLKLEGFTYGTSLDLNMGYYHIELDNTSKKLCTIVLPWGKYEYQRLPMGLCTSVDLFQEKMSSLMTGLDFVRTYLDDILVITKGTFSDHLIKLSFVLQRLRAAGLKVNAKKCTWAKPEIEYLGYLISHKGMSPMPKKIEAIHKIHLPKTKKELRSFIGMVNYYRDMWPKRAEILAPLVQLTSKTTP